jgi:transitional endoplasmic reticulum ATPase
VASEVRCSASWKTARTDDYLTAIADTRPTLTDAMLSEFEEDIALRTRL